MTAINESEVHRYLTKPWDTTELREIVSSALLRSAELRRASEVSRNVAARDAMLVELEREYPGIRRTTREDGAYVIDAERIAKVAEGLEDESLRVLFDTEATLGPRRDGKSQKTQRSGE